RLSGKVNTRNTVPKVALTKAIMSPAIIAQPNPATVTAESGRTKAARKTASPVNSTSMINRIINSFIALYLYCFYLHKYEYRSNCLICYKKVDIRYHRLVIKNAYICTII